MQRKSEIVDDNLLTVQEVADELRISKMTVYRLCHNGELLFYKVGKSFRITEGSVRAFLKID